MLRNNNLTGVNLAGQNLTGADFPGSKLANANLSQANLTNANFSRFDVYGNLLPVTDLTGADLNHANLSNATFAGFASYDEYGFETIYFGANLTNANLSAADARGARFEYATLTGANFSNLIQSNGHIAGLNLTAGASLVVRDYDGNPSAYPTPIGSLPIVVELHLAMDATGTLQLVFEADAWDSTISFTPGISVARGGTLELLFAPGVDLASQFGRTIDLFDWIGVTPSGAFTISSPYTWNLSKLYTTGEVTLTSATAGDVNLDGAVDVFDVNAVSTYWGTAGPQGDANGDGTVDIFDVNLISSNWSPINAGSVSVPEPASLALLALGLPFLLWRNVAGRRHCGERQSRPRHLSDARLACRSAITF